MTTNASVSYPLTSKVHAKLGFPVLTRVFLYVRYCLPSTVSCLFFPLMFYFKKAIIGQSYTSLTRLLRLEANFTKHRVFYASVRITWCAQPLIDFVIVFQFEQGDKEGKHLLPWITIHAIFRGCPTGYNLKLGSFVCKQPMPILPKKINELMLIL